MDTAGALTLSRSITAAPIALSIVIHPSKQFAYGLPESSNTIMAYKVDPESAALDAQEALQLTVSPRAIAFLPSGQFAYVASGTNVFVCTVHPETGVLSNAGSQPFVSETPRRLAVDPSGRFLFVLTSGSRVQSFGVGDDGALTLIDTDAVALTAANVKVSGGFLYVPSIGGTVSIHSIAADGALERFAEFNGGHAQINSFVISPSGRFAYADTRIGQDPHLSTFEIDAEGNLRLLEDRPGLFGELEVDPSGKFLFLANGFMNAVLTFGIDQDTGALTSELSSVEVAEPSAINTVKLFD